jgi:5-hydroxyisourate hydrolase
MSQITTHILDTTIGRPASGVTITLFHLNNHTWTEVATDVTNMDGRIKDLLPDDLILEQGTYKMKFDTKEYFDHLDVAFFYPFVEIVFSIDSEEHYHIPLLLNPYGYSTYRGS